MWGKRGGCLWEQQFWALPQAAMPWLAHMPVLGSLNATKENLLGVVRPAVCQFSYIGFWHSFTMLMMWFRCTLHIMREMARLFLLFLILLHSSWLCLCGPAWWLRRKLAHLLPALASPLVPRVAQLIYGMAAWLLIGQLICPFWWLLGLDKIKHVSPHCWVWVHCRKGVQ